MLGTKGESYSIVNGEALIPSDTLSVQEIGNGVQFVSPDTDSAYSSGVLLLYITFFLSKLSKSLAQLFADRDTDRGT